MFTLREKISLVLTVFAVGTLVTLAASIPPKGGTPNFDPQGAALQVVPGVAADTAKATATSTTLTYAAVPGKAHVLSMLCWAYNHPPSAGTIAVYDGDGSSSTQIIFQEAVTTDGPGFPQQWNPAKVGTRGKAMTIKLVNSDATVTGYINATHYQQ